MIGTSRGSMSHLLRTGLISLITVLVALGATGAERVHPSYANPSRIWVVNQHVADALNGSPVNFGTAAGRTAVAAELDAFEAASGGQIGLDSSAIAAAGTPTVLVRTDGSTSPVV